MTLTAASAIIAVLWIACGVLIWRNLRLRRLLREARRQGRREVHSPGLGDHKRLMNMLNYPKDALPKGGDWRIGDDLLCQVIDLIDAERPEVVVELGSGLSTAAIARKLQLQGHGKLWSLEHDSHFREETAAQIADLGLGDQVVLLDAPLSDFNKQNQWYSAGSLDQLPDRIDLLLIDGPPHHAGKTPRYPAGPMLFARMAQKGTVILDDGKRQKEQKTLQLWASEFPEFAQLPTDTKKQAVMLRRKGTI